FALEVSTYPTWKAYSSSGTHSNNAIFPARISSLTLAKGVNFGKKRDSPECQVRTNYGLIEGRRYTAKDGFKMDAFLGVPYAQPPVGELRFKVSYATLTG
ncbi:unnamed protein product, partial [Strongylus vulgaris]